MTEWTGIIGLVHNDYAHRKFESASGPFICLLIAPLTHTWNWDVLGDMCWLYWYISFPMSRPSRSDWKLRWSSVLKETKSVKYSTRKSIHFVRAWGRNRVYWWWKRTWSCAYRSAGSSTSKYWNRRVWSRCRRRSSKACHLHTTGIWVTAAGAVEVDASRGVSVLAKFSTLRTVLASLIHSRKLDHKN